MAVLFMAFGLTRMQLVSLRGAVAEAKAVATDQARKKDSENAALAAAVDQAYLEKRDAMDKADDANRKLARSRGLHVRAKCDLPGKAATAGGGESGTTEVRLSDALADDILAIGRDADRAAIYAQACRSWAISVGKP